MDVLISYSKNIILGEHLEVVLSVYTFKLFLTVTFVEYDLNQSSRIPEHMFPSPRVPFLHTHVYDPSVFVHSCA